ncbi:MAG: hypothetical protein AAFV53_34595, partial [Myxococcota bacterium]
LSSERRGLHLLAAGDAEAALLPLLYGAQARRFPLELRRAQWLMEQFEHALTSIGASQTDARWGRGWLQRAEVESAKGHNDACRAWLDKIEAVGPQPGWEPVRVRAAILRAHCAYVENHNTQALAEINVAIERGRKVSLELFAWSRFQRSRILNAMGQYAAALEDVCFAEANMDGILHHLNTQREKALIYIRIGEDARARETLTRLQEEIKDTGYTEAISLVLMSLSQLHRSKTDTQGLAYARESLRLFRQLGSANAPLMELEIAYQLTLLERYEEAIAHWAPLIAIEPQVARLCRTPCAAALGLWSLWEEDLRLGRPYFDGDALFPEVGHALEQAGDVALSVGEPERAAEAWRLSARQWQRMQRMDDLARVEQKLA